MKKIIFILVITLVSSINSSAQILFDTAQVTSIINSCDYIFEGRVIEKNTYEYNSDGAIYTTSLIQISKIFKGDLECGTVEMLMPGGRYGDRDVEFSHVDRFEIGLEGIFGCKNSDFPHQQVVTLPNNTALLSPVQYYNGVITYHGDPFNALAEGFGVSLDDINMLYAFLQFACGVNYTNCNALQKPEITYMQKKEAYFKGKKTRSIPVVSSINNSTQKPALVQGGTKDTVYIRGTSFGNTRGSIFTRDANDGGNRFISLNYSDIKYWSDTLIKLFIPGKVDSGYFDNINLTYLEGVPSSGRFYIVKSTNETSDTAINSTALNTLNVRYSLLQIVDKDSANTNNHKANPFLFSDTSNFATNGYVFHLHNSITNNNMINCIKTAMRRWSCLTGVNFTLASGTTSDTIKFNDEKNIIQLKKPPTNSPVALTKISTFNFACVDNITNYYRTPTRSFDIYINPSFSFWYDTTSVSNLDSIPAGFSDFFNVILHEFGHAHLLNHVADLDDVMFFQPDRGNDFVAIPASDRAIKLNGANQRGGDIIVDHSVNLGACAVLPPMLMLDTSCRVAPLTINEIVQNEYNFSIYPNPVSSTIHIDFDEYDNHKKDITIVDVYGRVVYKSSLRQKQNQIDLELVDGMYFVILSDKNSIFKKKVLWKK